MKHYKWRLYADNNIEEEIVEHLRSKEKMDVLWVHDDCKLCAQEDLFHYQNARKLGRYLLTHDEDFWNDRQYLLRDCPGLIILPKNAEAMAKYFPKLLRNLINSYNLTDRALYLDATKTRLTLESITIKMIDAIRRKRRPRRGPGKNLG